MKATIGIDIGGSTTKIAGFTEEKKLLGTLQVKASDQITSLYGALGRFLREHGLSLADISKIVLTGVGASFIEEDIYAIPTVKAVELDAIARGGLALAGLDEALVVSIVPHRFCAGGQKQYPSYRGKRGRRRNPDPDWPPIFFMKPTFSSCPPWLRKVISERWI